MDALLIAIIAIIVWLAAIGFIMAIQQVLMWNAHRKLERCPRCGERLCRVCHKECRQGEQL